MNITLPNRFFYKGKYGNYAYIKDGILYIKGSVDYEDLMYNLAYALKGKKYCCYCRRKVSRSKITLDHVYPRAYGGISIPDNLVPCCSRCNRDKTNMTVKQYAKWRRLRKKDKTIYYEDALRKNQRMTKNFKILPSEWITEYDISEVLKQVTFEQIERDGNEKVNQYYKKYKHYPRPIIVSRNGWVFKGMHILYHAKSHGITSVKAVVLDNVIRLKKGKSEVV